MEFSRHDLGVVPGGRFAVLSQLLVGHESGTPIGETVR